MPVVMASNPGHLPSRTDLPSQLFCDTFMLDHVVIHNLARPQCHIRGFRADDEPENFHDDMLWDRSVPWPGTIHLSQHV